MRFLCVSDVHGRADALAKVLLAADRRGGDYRLLAAGDHCFPGPEPLAALRLLTGRGALMTQGLTDRAVASLDLARVSPGSDHERARLAQVASVRAELGEVAVRRLGALPLVERLSLPTGDELALGHGCPRDPSEPLSHDMSDEELALGLGDDTCDLLVCGGSHVPFDRFVAGVRIINVGSVGEPPTPGFAHATWLTVTGADVVVEQLDVPVGFPS